MSNGPLHANARRGLFIKRDLSMAIVRKIDAKPLNAIEVITRGDDAIDEEKSNYDEYLKTGDPAKLVFVEGKQPTVFLCNFALKGRQAEIIKNSMIGSSDDEGNPKIAMGTWSFRVAKYVLKAITSPESVPADQQFLFKSDKDGFAHDDLIAELDRYGIVADIFSMYSNLVLAAPRGNAKN